MSSVDRTVSNWPEAPAAGSRSMDRTDPASLYLVPLVVFLVSRALLAALAHAAPHLLTPLKVNATYLPHSDPLAAVWDWASPWFRFDARWYVDVAEHGYRYGAIQVTNTNFFPLYPLLIRAVQPVTLGSPWISALLVSNLAFLAAMILLWHWALSRWSQETALRVLLLTVAFPFSFFFAAPYAEPLFLALAVAALYCADRGWWLPAAVLGGLSAVTRPVGLAVIAALVVLALARRQPRGVAVACLATLPFLAFVAYLWVDVGHPLAFTVYHTYGWVPPHGGLVTTITSQFHTKLSPFDRVDAALSLLFLASAYFVWRALNPAYAVYVVAGLVLPLIRSLAGMERYVIVLFPAIAAWATWKSRWGQAIIFALSLLSLTIATIMFAAGYSIF